jgi:hypothetical protein
MNEYTNEEIEVLRAHYTSHGPKYCADLIGRSIHSVHQKAQAIGIAAKHPKTPDEYRVNPNTFINCNSKEAAYILGLLWADGTLHGKSEIILHCVKDDIEIFYPTFKATGDWDLRFYQQPNRKPDGTISTCNKIMSDYLRSVGYGPHTFDSASKAISAVPDSLKPLWFRGLLDGDGCWHTGKRNTRKVGHAYCVSVAGAYQQDWSYFAVLFDELNIKWSVIKVKRELDNGKVHSNSVIRVCGKSNLISLGDYIYSSYSDDKIGLPRKYDKYLFALNNEH